MKCELYFATAEAHTVGILLLSFLISPFAVTFEARRPEAIDPIVWFGSAFRLFCPSFVLLPFFCWSEIMCTFEDKPQDVSRKLVSIFSNHRRLVCPMGSVTSFHLAHALLSASSQTQINAGGHLSSTKNGSRSLQRPQQM